MSIFILSFSRLNFPVYLFNKNTKITLCLEISTFLNKITIYAFRHLTFKRFASLLLKQRTIYLLNYLPWRCKWNTNTFFRFLLRFYPFLFILSYLWELWILYSKIWMLKHSWSHWLLCRPLDCSFALKKIIFDLICDGKLKTFKLISKIISNKKIFHWWYFFITILTM